MRRTLCSLAVAASLGVPSLALAQQPSLHDEAVKHFIEGRRLMRDDGNCPDAIRELEASVSKEPSIGGHYNLGICYEKTGDKKAALINYKKAEQIAKDKGDDRQREIGAQLRFFFEQTTHIRLALPQPTPPDLQVAIDGEALPNEEFEGLQIYFPPAKRKAYALRVSAGGYEDLKQTIDQSAVEKKIAVTVVLKKKGEGGAQPPPPAVETQWGPFQYGGLGLIALGATGVAYAIIAYADYQSAESNLRDQFREAEATASGCDSSSPPTSTCGKNIATREDLRFRYNSNEASARRRRPLLLTAGIGGVLAIAGGVLLILYGPRSEVEPSKSAKGPKRPAAPTFRVVPRVDVWHQGVMVTGTF
jgi:hypothetical protein